MRPIRLSASKAIFLPVLIYLVLHVILPNSLRESMYCIVYSPFPFPLVTLGTQWGKYLTAIEKTNRRTRFLRSRVLFFHGQGSVVRPFPISLSLFVKHCTESFCVIPRRSGGRVRLRFITIPRATSCAEQQTFLLLSSAQASLSELRPPFRPTYESLVAYSWGSGQPRLLYPLVSHRIILII